MANAIIDWLFSGNGVTNADGSMPATVQGLTAVPGPGASGVGDRPAALRFGPGASCRATLSPGATDPQRFAVRILFRATEAVTGRENLVESTSLPFSLFLDAGTAADRFNVVASVANGVVGWTSAHTSNRIALQINQWYLATLAYDLDTLALLIDDSVVAVTAFPAGGLQAGTGDSIFAGTWVDGARWPFRGEIAGVQVWHDIPETIEAKLDAERGTPEWHLTRKENETRPRLNLGPKTADFYYDPGTSAYIQPFALAVISYSQAHGVAFEMHGLILAKWRADGNLRRALGALASDEIDARRGGSRKSVFVNGCIYWSPQSGAFPVLGRMYLDYELIGEGVSAIGLPVADEETIGGGKRQRFQSGKMFFRTGASNAFEVHGAILAKYEAAGGPSQFGFPNSHEEDVLRGTSVIGKMSEFDGCTIYWSTATPASITFGGIRDAYRSAGGPLGDLGFPTSDEANVPGATVPMRYNTFQHGSIVWNGQPIVCRPFSFFVGRLDTREEDRDFLDLDGQNDLYCRIAIDVNGGRVYDKKIPEGRTNFASANIVDVNFNVPYVVVPNDPNLRVRFRVEVWESDDGNLFGGGDDNLGNLVKELNIANGWGLTDNAAGVFRTSNFGPWVNFLDWSVKPQITPATPFDNWGVENRGTATVDWREYAAAFGDVDPDFEIDFGIIDDGLKALYYELVVKGVASGGNCFGMSTEAIYAWKGLSRLGRPLSRFTNWSDVENDFNVRHSYQVGADALWWFVGQFLGGGTHDPVNVFQSTWDAFNRGLNPVICIAQNYDFSGAPHCIFPIAWNRNTNPWQITCFDPNRMNTPTTISVDSSRNTFRYDNGRVYEGGAWSGGRLHYMPWSVLNHRQRTPVWDAILLLLSGVVLIFADSTEVASLTDENGVNLDASAVTSREHLAGKLLRAPGISGDGPIRGGLYLGRQQRPNNFIFNPAIVNTINILAAAMPTPKAGATPTAPALMVGTLRPQLANPPALRLPVASDAPAGAIAGADIMRLLRTKGPSALRPPSGPSDLDTIHASLRGRSSGRMTAYLKRPMQGVHIEGAVANGENVSVAFDRMEARDNEIRMQSDRARRYDVTAISKLGAGREFVRVKVNGIPAESAAPARMNVQQGIGVLDIVAPGVAANAIVDIDGIIAGKNVKASFNVQISGGTRLVMSDLTDTSRLKVGNIDTLMGVARQFRTIPKR